MIKFSYYILSLIVSQIMGVWNFAQKCFIGQKHS